MERVIFHVDVNSAFLSWEACYRLHHLDGKQDLRLIPSAIGGDMSKRRGIILAKSGPAKAYGIKTGESVPEALRKCPNLVLAPPNYELYEKSSRAFMKILKEYSPKVEQYSVDEAFMEMTGSQLLYGDPILAATRIKDRIREELGFTVNIGISSVKVLAKMASDFKKPDRVHTLWQNEVADKMWPLPAGDLFFIGPATKRKLELYGIHTIGQVAKSDPVWLEKVFGKHGRVIWSYANGIDGAFVEPLSPAAKGYGNSTTIPYDVYEPQIAKKVLLSLAESIGRRVRADHVQVKCVAVGIRYSDFSYQSAQMMLDTETDITIEIYQGACRIFDRLWDGLPIRHLGIHTGKVKEQESCFQLSLFDDHSEERDRMRKADRAVDEIRKRFGRDAVMRGTFLKDPGIDHLSGGVSRERRTADYSKLTIK